MSSRELAVLVLAGLGAFTFGASYALSRSSDGAPARTSGHVRPAPAGPHAGASRVTPAPPPAGAHPERVAASLDTTRAGPAALAGANAVRHLYEPVERLHEGN